MTTTTVRLNSWLKGKHARIYVNKGREGLGYIECRTIRTGSLGSGYAARHQRIKGMTHDSISVCSIDGISPKILKAVDAAIGYEHVGDDTDWERWNAWVQFAKTPFNKRAKAIKISM